MLVQMARILKLHPIVGVVGTTTKVDEANKLGCDYVLCKTHQNLWEEARKVAPPKGFQCIMDANGVSTLQDSYDNLAPTGRLIVYGFHSNLPMGRDMLSPLAWLNMASKMQRMPKFDPMEMTVSNKAVMAFNLSTFGDEVEMMEFCLDQICAWLHEGTLKPPRVTQMDLSEIAEAHDLIQSGKTVGKLVINT